MEQDILGYQNIPVIGTELSRRERFAAMVWPMLDWFFLHARQLPWRENVSAYRVWISEIMLQQTRVEAVKPYYARFLQELPDAEALAKVPEERLMKLWEGLGYYSRARNLKKCALVLTERYDGVLPASYSELQKLPGIGSYTAGAIGSIAYGLPVPAVDGNVMRVLTRLCADDRDITKPAFKRELEEELSGLLERGAEGRTIPPGTFNQALMEIGATVCLPNGAPSCAECPLCGICLARIAGTQQRYPVKAPKKARKTEERTVFRIVYPEGYLVGKRPEKGLLAGLYEFPGIEGYLTEKQVQMFWENILSDTVQVCPLGAAKHIFSHVEWHMTGYEIRLKKKPEWSGLLREAKEKQAEAGVPLPAWNLLAVSKEEFETKLAMPSAFRAYMPER